MDSLKLAQLMCSRLCHDLITPVGAISTGLEIISESHEDIDPELLGLTSHSAQNAAQRLVYYRAAFGYTALSSLNTPEKLCKLISDYLHTYKIRLSWDMQLAPEDQDLFQDYARILVNLIGIMTECAPYGGEFAVSLNRARPTLEFQLRLTGDLVVLKADNHRALLGQLPDEEVTPHSVQSYLTHQFLEREEGVLDIQEATKSVLAFVLKADGVSARQYGSLF